MFGNYVLRAAVNQMANKDCGRLLAPCCTFDERTREVTEVDVDAVLWHLTLFDRYILDSVQLKEMPLLIAAFGCDGLQVLLESGRLAIRCQCTTIGQTGQARILEDRSHRGRLPLGCYSFSKIDAADYRTYTHHCLQELHKTDAATKRVIKLKHAVVNSLVNRPEKSWAPFVTQLQNDLRMQPQIVESSLLFLLRQEQGFSGQTKLAIQVEEMAPGDFRVHTNLAGLGFALHEEHKIVERALLGLGGLHQRISEMQFHGAVSGFVESECALFEDRIRFLLRPVNPEPLNAAFNRIVSISGMPRFLPSLDRIDIHRFLEILETRECVEFRQWIASIGTASDAEIVERVCSLRARLESMINSGPAKIARFLTSTGLGLLPMGPVIGTVSGAIDSFLVERVLPSSGVWAFVNRLYPSVFRPKDS